MMISTDFEQKYKSISEKLHICISKARSILDSISLSWKVKKLIEHLTSGDFYYAKDVGWFYTTYIFACVSYTNTLCVVYFYDFRLYPYRIPLHNLDYENMLQTIILQILKIDNLCDFELMWNFLDKEGMAFVTYSLLKLEEHLREQYESLKNKKLIKLK